MGSRAKLYAVVGGGSVTGMFTTRELLQRGGNVRSLMRDPEKYREELEGMIAYFPRGKRGNLEYAAADVTKPETLAPALAGVEALIYVASGSSWVGEGGSYDVDFLGVQNTAQAAIAAGVKKFVLCSCFMVSDRQRFSLTRFFMNIGPKWRMMDHKWEGECALRSSGIAYTIIRPGALWLTWDGSGGSSGKAYVISASQGQRPLRGRIARSDLAAVLAACALDLEAAAGVTFDCAQLEPPVVLPHIDDGTRWNGLRVLVPDAQTPVAHNPWLGLFGLHESAPAPQRTPEEVQAAAAAAAAAAAEAAAPAGEADAAAEVEEAAAPEGAQEAAAAAAAPADAAG